MITRIFKVDRSAETNTMATDLAELFSNTQAARRRLIQINEFYQDRRNPFTTGELSEVQSAAEEFQALFFLGHSDEQTFGDFSAEEFAEHFDQAFEGPKKGLFHSKKPFPHSDKTKVKDIFIYGCKVGLANAGKNDSYAQRLANRLHDRGFTGVRVHAVAYEKQAPGETMYVEVIWQAALGDRMTRHGYISAHSVDERTETEVDLLRHVQKTAKEERSQKQAERQIKHKYAYAKTKRKPIADSVPPLEFLRRAENTYVPNETYRQRKQRIKRDPDHIEREARNRVIALITPVKDKRDLDIDKKNVLLRFLQALKMDWESTWQQICTSYKDEYKKLITNFGYTPKSETLDLLQQLSQGKLPPQAEEGLESKSDDEVEVEEKRSLISPRQVDRSDDSQQPRRRSGFFPSSSDPQRDSLRVLLAEVDSLHSKLDDEITVLRERSERACFSLFIDFELATKISKRTSLEAMQKAGSLGELQRLAREELGKTRVTWRFKNTCTDKWGVSRTADLLNKIVNTGKDEERAQLKVECC